MPELPEIEVLKRDLDKEVLGRRIKDVDIRPGSNSMKVIRRHGRRKEFQDLCTGAKVEKVERVGENLVLELDNGHSLVFFLDGVGQLLKTSASDDLEAHTHLVFSFTIGGQLRVIDPAKTSDVFIHKTDDLKELEGFSSTALDPLENQNPMTWQAFSMILEERAAPMRPLVRGDEFIVGLGDLYTDEVLWAAAIRYDRPSNKLSSQDVRRLYRALMETLQEAVKARGTSYGEHPFRDLHGTPGTYQVELNVYARDGQPCRRCRNQIETAEIDGARTFFCPQCQV